MTCVNVVAFLASIDFLGGLLTVAVVCQCRVFFVISPPLDAAQSRVSISPIVGVVVVRYKMFNGLAVRQLSKLSKGRFTKRHAYLIHCLPILGYE